MANITRYPGWRCSELLQSELVSLEPADSELWLHAGAVQQTCMLQHRAACSQCSLVPTLRIERSRAVAVSAASSSPLPADDSFAISIPQAPVQSLLRVARVLLKFSRPHTLLGTLVSVNSVSLLGLVRPADLLTS